MSMIDFVSTSTTTIGIRTFKLSYTGTTKTNVVLLIIIIQTIRSDPNNIVRFG